VLELEQHEVWALFKLLDDNKDGTVSYDEFLGGAVRMKGAARAVDSILIMHEQNNVKRMLRTINEKISQVGKRGTEELAHSQPLQDSVALLRAAASAS